MADYWKSQAKKYCDFCKCWFSDNKPSVEFHEKGRKHKENVARRLRQIGKQSRRDQKESLKMDSALRRMESAALEAYRKDIETNADISSRAINETLETQNLALSSNKVWHEIKNKDGATYYWNTETDESKKEPPNCGFLSLIEQQAQVFATGKKQLQTADKFRHHQDKLKLVEEKQQQEEERAAAEREKMKALRVVEPDEVLLAPAPILEEPSGPYGQWKTVATRPTRNVDLQLPRLDDDYIATAIPVAKPEIPLKVFKEKTVSSLLDEGEPDSGVVTFKKRKFGNKQARNVRQRFDND